MVSSNVIPTMVGVGAVRCRIIKPRGLKRQGGELSGSSPFFCGGGAPLPAASPKGAA